MCGVWSEHWQADPPPLQPLQQCWQHSYVYFPNTTSGYDAELDMTLNFRWPVWESESDNTKFNTPAPQSYLRPCNTNESHDTGERKCLIWPNLQKFEGCTHFCEILYIHETTTTIIIIFVVIIKQNMFKYKTITILLKKTHTHTHTHTHTQICVNMEISYL